MSMEDLPEQSIPTQELTEQSIKDTIHNEDIPEQSKPINDLPQEDDSDDEDTYIKITLKPQRPWSSYTEEELDELEKKYGECDYCFSLRLPEHMFKGHYSDNCPKLKKMRCDRCALFGHTGGHCPTLTKKLEIKCTFCFRGGKPESKYNSHTIDECIDKKNYDSQRYEYQEGGGYYDQQHRPQRQDHQRQDHQRQDYQRQDHQRQDYQRPSYVQTPRSYNSPRTYVDNTTYPKIPNRNSAQKYNQPFTTTTQDFPPLSKKINK
jgi:hypothetical protein